MTRRVKRPAAERAVADMAAGDELVIDVRGATLVVRFGGARRHEDGTVRGRVAIVSPSHLTRARLMLAASRRSAVSVGGSFQESGR